MAYVLTLAASLSLVCAVLLGCAGPAQSVNMIPERYDVAHCHLQAVEGHVEGGKSTNLLASSQIDNDAFRSALEEAITKVGVFARVRKDGGAAARQR